MRHSEVKADDRTGSAHWDADYTFSQTGRSVSNSIDADFEFQDGKIIKHKDEFNMWAWSRQALGVTGFLFGWLPPFQNVIKNRAMIRARKISPSPAKVNRLWVFLT